MAIVERTQSDFIPFWTNINGQSKDGKKCGVLFNADPRLKGMTDKQALYMLQSYNVSIETDGTTSFTVRTPDNVVVGFINNVKHSLTDKSKVTTKAKVVTELEGAFKALELSDINSKGMTEELAASILEGIPA